MIKSFWVSGRIYYFCYYFSVCFLFFFVNWGMNYYAQSLFAWFIWSNFLLFFWSAALTITIIFMLFYAFFNVVIIKNILISLKIIILVFILVKFFFVAFIPEIVLNNPSYYSSIIISLVFIFYVIFSMSLLFDSVKIFSIVLLFNLIFSGVIFIQNYHFILLQF